MGIVDGDGYRLAGTRPRLQFQVQKPLFSVNAAGVAGETSVSALDPVAGNDEGNGIMPYGVSDCLGGHGGAPQFLCRFPGKLPVGRGHREFPGEDSR